MKTQINSQHKTPRKWYRKRNEDICDLEKWNARKKFIGFNEGSLDELILKFRNFYKESHPRIFGDIIREIWLEQQITFNGIRGLKRIHRGPINAIAFGQFTSLGVGTSGNIITNNTYFTPIATYLIDFFPEFLFDDPTKSLDNYKYPYKNVTLDHLAFVYQMDNRLDLLKEAEDQSMNYGNFMNWAINWAMENNIETGKNKYQLIVGYRQSLYIRNNKLRMGWQNKKFNFNVR